MLRLLSIKGVDTYLENQTNISNTLPSPDKTGVKTITADKMIKIDHFTG